MRRRHRPSAVLASVALLVAVGACGDDTGSTASGGVGPVAEPSPLPAPATLAELCPDGEAPVLAAYSLDHGRFQWATCSTEQLRHDVQAVTEDAVFVGVTRSSPFEQWTVAYDPDDGTELPDGGPTDGRPEPPPPFTGDPSVFFPEVDGVRIEGGQDDPTTAVDVATGERLWTQPGSPPYDDVWAVGDGAVFVIDRTSVDATRLVAYEVDDGEVRWQLDDIDPYGTELGWPWHVQDDVLFTIWSNLALLSTDDGTTIWRTDYPVVELLRMTGVRADDDTVYVAFSSTPSGGD